MKKPNPITVHTTFIPIPGVEDYQKRIQKLEKELEDTKKEMNQHILSVYKSSINILDYEKGAIIVNHYDPMRSFVVLDDDLLMLEDKTNGTT